MVQWRGTEGRRGKIFLLGMQEEPLHSRNRLFRCIEMVSLVHPTFLPSRSPITMTLQASFDHFLLNDLSLCLFTSAKQAQQLRKQLNGISRERDVLLLSGKWNQQGQKKPPPLSNTSWGCIDGFQPTALACLCLITVASQIENLARTPHLKNNRPSLFKGSWSSSDSIASSSNSVRSKHRKEEPPCWSWGSGGVSHMAVLSLVESHPLYVFIAWLQCC